MKLKNIILFAAMISFTGHGFAQVLSEGNVFRSPFKSDMDISANTTGDASLVKEEEEVNMTGYDYRAESWDNNDPSSGYYWTDYAGNCSLSLSQAYVRIQHGQGTCWRTLSNRVTNGHHTFLINPDDDFDISFNAYKSSYGSNYVARAYMMSDAGDEIFYWRYHRDGADYFRTPVGSVGINEGSDLRYRVEKVGSIMRMYVGSAMVSEGEYIQAGPISIKTFIGANNVRFYFKNLDVKITQRN